VLERCKRPESTFYRTVSLLLHRFYTAFTPFLTPFLHRFYTVSCFRHRFHTVSTVLLLLPLFFLPFTHCLLLFMFYVIYVYAPLRYQSLVFSL